MFACAGMGAAGESLTQINAKQPQANTIQFHRRVWRNIMPAEGVTRAQLYEFIRKHRHAVVATNSHGGTPEAALVYIAVTPELELIFHALQWTRKCANLRRDPRIAAVIGWDGMQTLQYEGIADEPQGFALDEAKRTYLEIWPEALQRITWPDLTFFRIRPKWIRFSDYGRPWSVEELDLREDAAQSRSRPEPRSG